jgi:hypothetical protein
MKKQLLSIFALMSFGAVTAQITITQADVASLGYVIFRGTDTTFTETPIGPGGTGMSWDFSGIVDDTGDTLAISDPVVLPNYSDFPSSNIAIINGGGTAYGILNSSSLSIIGQTAMLQVLILLLMLILRKLLRHSLQLTMIPILILLEHLVNFHLQQQELILLELFLLKKNKLILMLGVH